MNAHLDPIALLIAELRAAKSAEAMARDIRIGIEEQIVALYTKPASGEATAKGDGFTITWSLTRTVDTAALQAGWNTLGANTQLAFKWKAETDLKQLRALQDLDQPAYQQAAQFITAKTAKPAITLKTET